MASKNVETFRAVHQAFNRRDLETLFGLLADDFHYDDRARGIGFTGRGFNEFLSAWTGAFSDATVADPTYIDGGDTIVALFRGIGIHDGALDGIPASGRNLDLPFCEIMHFNAEGKIVSGEIYYDRMALLSQVGASAEAVHV